jgi:Flp pilus assembly protein TadG
MLSAIARFATAGRGTAAIETAVVLPFLMLLALGTADLGRFFHAQIAIATSARNGAQYGSSSVNASLDTAGIQQVAQAEMQSVNGFSSSNPTVTVSRMDEGGGQFSIRVTVQFRFFSLIKYPGLPQSLTLTRTVHMRVLPINIQDDEEDEDA